MPALVTITGRIQRLSARRGVSDCSDGVEVLDPFADDAPTLTELAAASVRGSRRSSRGRRGRCGGGAPIGSRAEREKRRVCGMRGFATPTCMRRLLCGLGRVTVTCICRSRCGCPAPGARCRYRGRSTSSPSGPASADEADPHAG